MLNKNKKNTYICVLSDVTAEYNSSHVWSHYQIRDIMRDHRVFLDRPDSECNGDDSGGGGGVQQCFESEFQRAMSCKLPWTEAPLKVGKENGKKFNISRSNVHLCQKESFFYIIIH